MINVEETIISQYGKSASITQLVRGIDNYLDPRADIDLFIEQVWDISTATGWGLDTWGLIIGLPRYIQVAVCLQPVEGIGDTDVYYIPDDDYRDLLFFKAAVNITNCSAKSINSLLNNKFSERGRVYVLDLGRMVMRYVFEFALTFWEKALFTTTPELFPKTTGVFVDFYEIPDYQAFGFYGSGLLPFDQFPFSNKEYGYFPCTFGFIPFGFDGSGLMPFNIAPFTDRS